MTTSEAEVARWRERERALHRAVDELHEAGMVARAVEERDSRVVPVVWIPVDGPEHT